MHYLPTLSRNLKIMSFATQRTQFSWRHNDQREQCSFSLVFSLKFAFPSCVVFRRPARGVQVGGEAQTGERFVQTKQRKAGWRSKQRGSGSPTHISKWPTDHTYKQFTSWANAALNCLHRYKKKNTTTKKLLTVGWRGIQTMVFTCATTHFHLLPSTLCSATSHKTSLLTPFSVFEQQNTAVIFTLKSFSFYFFHRLFIRDMLKCM